MLACDTASEDEVQLHGWRSPRGRSWLIASERLTGPGGPWIEALLDRSRNRAVLRSYREQLALVTAPIGGQNLAWPASDSFKTAPAWRR